MDAGEPSPTLSAREREIARLLVEGYSVLNVSALVGIGENTVRTYVRRLYRKLGVCNRAQLCARLQASRETTTEFV
jgi:DNA-binding CsgD family transcriptional regulator